MDDGEYEIADRKHWERKSAGAHDSNSIEDGWVHSAAYLRKPLGNSGTCNATWKVAFRVTLLFGNWQ